MKYLCVLLCLLPVALALNNRDWETFKVKFERKYRNPSEESYRKRVFLQNKAFIDQHNQKYADGQSTFTLAINQFADMTNEEFGEKLSTYDLGSIAAANKAKEYKSSGLGYNVVTVDWRDVGCVPLVKDQGECTGAGYAFSAITCLEFINCRVNKNMTLLSEQNLLDCSAIDGNRGCVSGTINGAFQYIIEKVRGVDTAEFYPYTGVDSDVCYYNITYAGGGCTEIQQIPSGDEVTLADANSYMGPIAATIDASQPSFQFYSSGMYIEANCSSSELNHAVTIIGYGFENAGNYWLVRNSWGYSWGDNGYIQMAKDLNNQCGIATLASLCLY